MHSLIDADRKVMVMAIAKGDYPRDYIVKVLNRCARDAALEQTLTKRPQSRVLVTHGCSEML